jgi:transcriptional regulator with XRE-family HTH domain
LLVHLCAGHVEKSIHSSAQAELSRLLREHRTHAGLRQVDLAQRLNKPQSFVSKYENGERRLDHFEIEQICVAIGIDEIQLMQDAKQARKG